jgi:imidazole glycerol-phosphate synthase subunit HisH
MISIVDYGVGNIQSFLNLFKRIECDVTRATTPEALADATHLILPGVGHFDHAMQMFNTSGMRNTLQQLVQHERVPILGICVGMQMLAHRSDEGVMDGLGWIPGVVKSFSTHPSCSDLPMPHMGWNSVRASRNASLVKSDEADVQEFYFLHSYYFDACDKADVAATANYGIEFEAMVQRGNIYGVQCHPEKSHRWGENLLRNFVNI